MVEKTKRKIRICLIYVILLALLFGWIYYCQEERVENEGYHIYQRL